MLIDPKNIHHSYLIEGEINSAVAGVMELLEVWEVKTSGNPDFHKTTLDVFKIADARELKGLVSNKSISSENSKRVFVLAFNQILAEAQNTLLKSIEEPSTDTHFFIITPNINNILPTVISRCEVVKVAKKSQQDFENEVQEFIKMSRKQRIEFLKDFIKVEAEEIDSPKARSLKFLDELEQALAQDATPHKEVLSHIFGVRKYLAQPSVSVKTLMESVALAL